MSELPFPYDERKERIWDIYMVLGLLVIPALVSAIISNFEPGIFGPLNLYVVPTFVSLGSLLVCVANLRRSPWKLEDHDFTQFEGKYIPWGIAVYMCIGFIMWFYTTLQWILIRNFMYAANNLGIDSQIIDKPMIPFFIIHMILNSLLEEFTMRGVLQTHFTALTNSSTKGIIIANLIFASYHIYQGPFALIPIFIFGVGLSFSRIICKSLWPAIIAHTIYNIALFYPMFER